MNDGAGLLKNRSLMMGGKLWEHKAVLSLQGAAPRSETRRPVCLAGFADSWQLHRFVLERIHGNTLVITPSNV